MAGHPAVPAVRSPGVAQPVPGTILAGHRVEAMVGRGGMGVVYRARHCRLGRVVALKVIAPELLEDAAVQRRFARGGRRGRVVRAPEHRPGVRRRRVARRALPGHAVRARDGPRRDGAARRSARARARGRDRRRRWATRWTRCTAPATCTATSSRANVLIAAGGHVYLTDFGLARRVASGSGRPAPATGSARVDYAAPEQIRGGHIDARTDVYALGCLLFRPHGAPAVHSREPRGAAVGAPARAAAGAVAAAARAAAGAGRARRPRARQGPSRPLPSAGELGRAALMAAAGTSDVTQVAEPATPSPRPRLAGASSADAPTVSCVQPAPARLVRPEAAPLAAAAVP